jgi:hypothetical protein
MDGVMIGLLVPLGAFAMVVLIIWLVNKSNRDKMSQQVELQKQFMNRFGTSQDLSQFLETPQGQRFLKGLAIEGSSGSPKERVIASVKGGIVLMALGGGFFALMRLEYDLIYPAVILSFLGVGLLISSAATYWLSKKWGIFEERDIPLQKRIEIK